MSHHWFVIVFCFTEYVHLDDYVRGGGGGLHGPSMLPDKAKFVVWARQCCLIRQNLSCAL